MVVQAKVVPSVNCTVQPVQRLQDLARSMPQFLSWIGGRPFLAKTGSDNKISLDWLHLKVAFQSQKILKDQRHLSYYCLRNWNYLKFFNSINDVIELLSTNKGVLCYCFQRINLLGIGFLYLMSAPFKCETTWLSKWF